VEDDSMVWKFVTAQIESLGYGTLSAPNARDALALIDNGAQFDLLFTDVMMPGLMNGRQLADETSRRRSSLRVLFTSGFTENAMIHHGRLDPAVHLLGKPYRRSELARMIRVALDSAPKSCGGLELGRSGRFEFGFPAKSTLQRYQARMVSGRATLATSTRALRPRR
jgi:CheY-like chemotaxis protein